MKRIWAPAALAAGALVLAGVVVTRGGEPGPAPRTESEPAVEVDPLLFPRKGLRLDRPTAWSAKRRRGVVRLRSGDRRIAVSIATQSPAVGAPGARRSAERTIRAAYGAVRVINRRPSTLGGHPARAVELVARGKDGALVDVLIVGGASPWRSYALTAVSLRPTTADALRQLGAVVGSVSFLRPA